MSSFRISAGVVALCMGAGLALAGEPAPKSAKKAKSAPAKSAPDASALDKRVAEAKHVFVGEGMRIYFVDRQFREVPYVRAAGDGAYKSAVVVVRVVDMLRSPGGEKPARVLVPIETSRDVYGQGLSPFDRHVDQYVGKQGIWLGEVVVRKDYGDDKSGRKPLEDPVTLLQTPQPDAKRRVAAEPLPMTQLKQVKDSIAGRSRPAVASPDPATAQ
jgi:hypothetical protein